MQGKSNKRESQGFKLDIRTMHCCVIVNELHLKPFRKTSAILSGHFIVPCQTWHFFVCKMPTFKNIPCTSQPLWLQHIPLAPPPVTTSAEVFFSVFLIQPAVTQPPLLPHIHTGCFQCFLVLIMNIASCLHVSSQSSKISIC